MRIKQDNILDKEREKDVIPQLNADPASPIAEDAWILRTGTSGTGGGVIKLAGAMGFIYPSKGAGGSTSYQFSYRTKEGTTKRITLT